MCIRDRFDTLKELKADIKKKITEERENAAQQTFEDNLMQQVAENITADVPDAMVDAQARRFLDNFKNQIQQQGIPYDQYLKMTGMDESKLLEDAKEPAPVSYTHLEASWSRTKRDTKLRHTPILNGKITLQAPHNN